jgi:hypothetical protein
MANSGRNKEKITARAVPSRAFSTQYSAGFSTFLFNEFLAQDTSRSTRRGREAPRQPQLGRRRVSLAGKIYKKG